MSTKAPRKDIGEEVDLLPAIATAGAVTVIGKVATPDVEIVSAAVDDTEGEPSLDSDLSSDPCWSVFSPALLSLTRDKC